MTNPLTVVHDGVTHTIERVMYGLGKQAVRKPCRLIGFAVLSMFVLFAGVFIHINNETDGQKMWPPQESEAFDDNDFIEASFESREEANQILIAAKSPFNNVLDKAVLSKAMEAHARAIAVTSGDVTWSRICALVPGTTDCFSNSILYKWDYSQSALAADTNVVDTVRNKPYPNGRPSNPDDVGGWDGDAGAAFRIQLMVDTGRAERNGVDDDGISSWEAAVADEVNSWNYDEFTALPFMTRSMDDALNESVGGDMLMVVLGVTGMFVYAYMVMSRRPDAVHSRFALTWAATGAVILGMLGSTGLISAIGLSITSLNQILIYVLCGIGIDDAFIITSALDQELYKARQAAERQGRTDPALPENQKEFEKVFARALANAGSSIAFTSLTDLVAFYMGSITRIPAVSWFCIYAGTAVFFVFIMQVTVYASCLAMDTRRQARRRRDVITCSTVTKPIKPTPDLTLMQWVMKKYFGPFVTRKRSVHAVVVVAFLGLAVMASLGVTNMKRGLPLIDLTPDTHYVRDFLTDVDIYWRGFQYTNAKMLFRHQPLANGDTHAEQVVNMQIGMYAARHAISDKPQYVQQVSDDWWLASFLQYAAGQPALASGLTTRTAPWDASTTLDVWQPDASQDIADALYDFIQAEPRFQPFLAISGTTAGSRTLIGSQATVFLKGQSDDQDVVDLLFDLRPAIRDAAAQYGMKDASIFSSFFIFTEMDAIMAEEAFLNMGMALIGVGCVCLVFLGSIKVTALVMGMVALIDISLLGSLHYFGLKLNTISVVNLVLALGLAVDYSAHLAHRFLERLEQDKARVAQLEAAQEKALAAVALGEQDVELAAKKPKKRVFARQSGADIAEEAMWVLGASVYNGGVSTFIAVLPLAAASSTIFYTFFVMMVSIVVLGMTHGLILLPTLLVLFGPRGTKGDAPSAHDSDSEPSPFPQAAPAANQVAHLNDPSADMSVRPTEAQANPMDSVVPTPTADAQADITAAQDATIDAIADGTSVTPADVTPAHADTADDLTALADAKAEPTPAPTLMEPTTIDAARAPSVDSSSSQPPGVVPASFDDEDDAEQSGNVDVAADIEDAAVADVQTGMPAPSADGMADDNSV